MNDKDATQEFMESLPTLRAGESFCFRCHREISCFNECCSDLNMALAPYDVLRLRRALGLSSKGFLSRFAHVGVIPDSGFPYVSLRMRDDEKHSCPFVDAKGCTVYRDRPGACRTYPLGRGASADESGHISSQYVLVQEEHCRGFEENKSWTIETWISDQEIGEYDLMSDSFLKLMSMWQDQDRPLEREHFSKVFVALYRPDEFPTLTGQPHLIDLLVPEVADREDFFTREKALLLFAMDWLKETVLNPNAEEHQGCGC